jgi:phosphoribosylformimino-5-aminoimidazole carboxamide ribotide isomerase
MGSEPGWRDAPLEIIPAVDLKDGRCVRLYQGDFSREILSEEPLGVALRWQEQGASRLHVVDLEGAATGRPVNIDIVREIASQARVPLQVGGGVRDMETARLLLEAGVQRVLLGTAAVESPDFVRRALAELGSEAVVVSVDARGGRVALRGWKEESGVDALELLGRMAEAGVRRFVYTDIAQDGTLTQPNFDAVAEAISTVDCPVIAAGGISSVEHLLRLAELGAEGAIVGTALYTGAIDLREAVRLLDQGSPPG